MAAEFHGLLLPPACVDSAYMVSLMQHLQMAHGQCMGKGLRSGLVVNMAVTVAVVSLLAGSQRKASYRAAYMAMHLAFWTSPWSAHAALLAHISGGMNPFNHDKLCHQVIYTHTEREPR